jgi:hypothetical protein
MLLIKLGILAFLGKGYYSAFLVAHLINHINYIFKNKLMEVIK